MQRLLKHSAITDVQYTTSDAPCAIIHIYPESLTHKTNYNFKLAKKERIPKLLSILIFLLPGVQPHSQLFASRAQSGCQEGFLLILEGV